MSKKTEFTGNFKAITETVKFAYDYCDNHECDECAMNAGNECLLEAFASASARCHLAIVKDKMTKPREVKS